MNRRTNTTMKTLTYEVSMPFQMLQRNKPHYLTTCDISRDVRRKVLKVNDTNIV
jgi:hypothetical protein